MGRPDGGGRVGGPGLNTQDPPPTKPQTTTIVADSGDRRAARYRLGYDHRAGLELGHRLAVSRYGQAAILPPPPPGPAVCPPWCPSCAGRRRPA